MNYKLIFYWLTVADNARTLWMWGCIIFTIIAGLATIVNIWNRSIEIEPITSQSSKDEAKAVAVQARSWMKWAYPFAFLFWALYVLTPSKRDALLIIAGGETLNFLTTDSSANQIPKELSNFVVSELRSMASDAKVELNLNNAKEQVLQKAKQMSTEELLSTMKSDSTFAKIILNNK